MNKEKEIALNRNIVIYWWNGSSKQLDYKGTYKKWFDENKIKITVIKYYIHFSGTFGNMEFKMRLRKDYEHSFNQIIKLCLMYLGDKALLLDGFNREYKINWR